MNWEKESVCRNLLGRLAFAVALFHCAAIATADTGVGLFVDQQFVPAGGPTHQVVTVSGFSTEQVQVDVHIGLIAPNQTIYEFPNWNTNLQPWLSNLTLPAGFSFPATTVFDTANFPGGLTPGTWWAAVALTEPGTLNFIDVDLVPFAVVDQTAGAGTSYGSVSLSRLQSSTGVNVGAGGVFVDVSGTLADLENAFVGNNPGINECVLSNLPIDFSGVAGVSVDTLDAGDALRLVRGGTTLQIPKDPESASIGFEVYSADPANSFYQGGANYSFAGDGGSEIGPFSVAVTAPAALNLIQPAPAPSLNHNVATPLALQWDGASGTGEVTAALVASTLSRVVTILCRFADDGNGTIPANLITQMKNILDADSSGTSIPGLGDIELPPGFEIPDFSSQAILSVMRINWTVFDTTTGDLDIGVASISSGADMTVILQ